MKRIFLIPLVILVVSAFIFGGCAAPAPAPAPAPTPAPAPSPAPAPIKLIIAEWEGTEGSFAVTLREYWKKELEERSRGRVKVEIAYGSVMGKPPEHYDLAVTGVADISHVGLPYTPGRFPMAEVIEMPISGILEYTSARAYWELYKKGYFDNDFKDVKVLYLTVVGPYDYQMAKKPVLTVADMKGLKMRSSGRVHTEMVKALGSVPVGMPAPEIYVSLEKGVIDGSFTPWSFMKAFRTEPVVSHVTEPGIGGFGHALVMNKDSYNKLPADIRAIIDDMSYKYVVLQGSKFTSESQVAKGVLFKGVGGQVHQLSEADMKKVDEAMAPIWQKWIAEGEAKGLPRKQMLADLYDILQYLGVEKPFRGYAP